MQRITIFAITLMSVIFILSIVLILLERAYHLELPLQKNSINSYCQSNKYKKVERKGYLSDKYQVKKYINKNYEYIKTAKVLLYSKDLEEIKNFNYPADFVLKSSAGSRMFLIVENGEYKINNLVNKSKEFMNIDFANFGYRRIPFFGFEEPQYNHNKKAIMVEEHLGDVKEFRIMVINGKILYYDIPEEGFFGNDYQKINIKSDKVDLKALINRDDKYGEYAWSVISKIINYASSLVPGITDEFNDIDEAMRLGFNWSKGPFEMLEEIGVTNFFSKFKNYEGNKFLENLAETKNENFHGIRQKYTDIETLGKVKKTASNIDGNSSASIYRFNDYNIVEFTTKANALDYDSMDALKKATDKPLIIINESMQFSAGVNLSYTMEFAKKGDFKSIEKFVGYFQETCKHLKYSDHPVVSAPSGLTLGGGFEVMVQSNFVASHTNIVVGLVETIVGLIPAGGGCKEMLARWLDTDEAKNDPHYAPLKVFDIIGYGRTATSPVEAEPMKYLKPEDKKIMNRNSLLEVSKEILNNNKDFKAPLETEFKLPGKVVKEEMNKILEKLYNDKVILDHGLKVAQELAHVLSGGDTTIEKTLSEDDLFKLELDAFMRLIETKETQDRIKHTLATGKPLIN